jgi:hypothetical protein
MPVCLLVIERLTSSNLDEKNILDGGSIAVLVLVWRADAEPRFVSTQAHSKSPISLPPLNIGEAYCLCEVPRETYANDSSSGMINGGTRLCTPEEKRVKKYRRLVAFYISSPSTYTSDSLALGPMDVHLATRVIKFGTPLLLFPRVVMYILPDLQNLTLDKVPYCASKDRSAR